MNFNQFTWRSLHLSGAKEGSRMFHIFFFCKLSFFFFKLNFFFSKLSWSPKTLPLVERPPGLHGKIRVQLLQKIGLKKKI